MVQKPEIAPLVCFDHRPCNITMNRSAGLMLLHHGGSLLSVCEEHQPALYNARSIAACTLYTLLRNPCRHADLH